MDPFRNLFVKFSGIALLLVLVASSALAQGSGAVRGQVTDEFGGVVVGATVTVKNGTQASEKTTTTNDEGQYTFTGLAPGQYTVRAIAPGFSLYENPEVTVTAGARTPLDIKLGVSLEAEEVTVAAEGPINTDPANNAGAIVLRGSDIESLPEDPDDLAAALQALAGPSAGPNGGQIYIDGFTGGRLPPRSSIREIRINQNPFAAEFDRLGFGRIEILTKPGTDRLRGSAMFGFNDESLNSRNPFAERRADFQSRQYGGNLSGTLIKGRASFFVDFDKRDNDNNAVINALVLDENFNVVPFNTTVLTPQRRTSFNPRVDFQLSKNHTLVARYSYERFSFDSAGLSELTLPSRAYDRASTEHDIRITETAILSPTMINETRFSFERERATSQGDNSIPTINVLDSFVGGGSQIGLSFNNSNRWEFQNYTTWAKGTHSVKFGARLRGISIEDRSEQNFGGTYTFGGYALNDPAATRALVFDENGVPSLGPEGSLPIEQRNSLERYRRTLILQDLATTRPDLNITPAFIRALGGGATQFSIAGGNPLADVSQVDFGAFIQDDWRVRPDFMLSGGLRYENQSNINSRLNFAPRLTFAWSPGASAQRAAKTVIRGGFGVFYDRIGENLTLQANRFNGINQQQFVVLNPQVIDQAIFTFDGVTNVPTVDELTAFAQPQTTRVLADNIQAPYTLQTAFTLERQLPKNFTASVQFISTRTLHLLRSRNINAPLLDANGRLPLDALGRPVVVRPDPSTGNIYQYESSGTLNQNQLVFGVFNRLSPKITLFANYALNKVESDTEGPGTFAANQYDFTGEYGRSLLDIGHRFVAGGSFEAPWGIRLNPLIIMRSGSPFNITTGRDTNADTLFTERPAFADAQTVGDDLRATRFGDFDINPKPGQTIIPRNYGTGPSFFIVNLRASKTFSFGGSSRNEVAGQNAQGGRGDGGGRRGGGGGGGGGRRGGGDGIGGFGGGGGGRGGFGRGDGGGGSESRYSLTFSISVNNLFNHVNLANPIGNLTSPRFGQSTSTAGGFGFGSGGANLAGNRRVEANVRFNF
jgi:hypothetical protein